MKKAKKTIKADPTTKSKAKPTLSERIARAEKLLSESCDVTYRLGQLADRQVGRINDLREAVDGLVSWRDSEVRRLYARMDEVASTSEAAVTNLFLKIEALKDQIQPAATIPQAPAPQVVEAQQHPKDPEPKREYAPGYYVVQDTRDNALTIIQRCISACRTCWLFLGDDDESFDAPDDADPYRILFGPFSIADIHVPEKKEVPNE